MGEPLSQRIDPVEVQADVAPLGTAVERPDLRLVPDPFDPEREKALQYARGSDAKAESVAGIDPRTLTIGGIRAAFAHIVQHERAPEESKPPAERDTEKTARLLGQTDSLLHALVKLPDGREPGLLEDIVISAYGL